MAYDVEPRVAAKRHHYDGVLLFDKKRFDNAGYHFGLAAECAVKEGLVKLGGVPAGHAVVQKLHFPELRTVAVQLVRGRRSAKVHQIIRDPRLMQGWDIRMRYAPTGSVAERDAQRWREQALHAIQELLVL